MSSILIEGRGPRVSTSPPTLPPLSSHYYSSSQGSGFNSGSSLAPSPSCPCSGASSALGFRPFALTSPGWNIPGSGGSSSPSSSASLAYSS